MTNKEYIEHNGKKISYSQLTNSFLITHKFMLSHFTSK